MNAYLPSTLAGRAWRLPGLLLAVLSFPGCATLGPDYREPDVRWLDDWQTELYGQLGSPEQQAELDLRFWWQVFDDPALNALIDEARRENPTLRIAGLRILEARAVLGIADSGRLPQLQQLTANAGYVDIQQSGGAAPNDQSLASYDVGFNIGWELDFWGRFRRSIESADAAFFAAISNQQDVQVLLSAQVADLYFAYRTVVQQIEIARRNAAIQQRSFDIARLLFENGENSELDLQQARTQYLATLSAIPGLEINRTQLRNGLAALLGRPPGELVELGSAIPSLPTLDPIVINGIPGQLLLRRPDIRAAAMQVAAQSAQIGVAQADLYPAIALFGTIGWSGDTIDATSDSTTLALGPSVTWNLFDHGRLKNNVRVQDARLEQAIENYQNSVLQAAREIDDAAIGMVKTREQRAVLVDSVDAARRSLDIATVRYREGYADFQRVLDAQRALASQEEREVLTQGAHVRAVVNFYKALGGGWQPMTLEQMLPESTREALESRTEWGNLLETGLPGESAIEETEQTGTKHE